MAFGAYCLQGQRQEIEQAKAEREAELIARDSRIQELEAKIQEDETLHMEKCKEWEESTAEKEEEVLQMQTQIKELSEVALHHEAMMDNAKGILQSKLDVRRILSLPFAVHQPLNELSIQRSSRLSRNPICIETFQPLLSWYNSSMVGT